MAANGTPDSTQAPETARPTVSVPMAHALGWLLGAGVNATFLIATAPGGTRLSARLGAHLYDLGHYMALGMVSALVAALWGRFGPKRRYVDLVGLMVVAVGIGSLLLPQNVDNFASRMGGPTGLIKAAAVVAVAGTIPVAAFVGRRFGRSRIVWFTVAGATLAFAANNLIMRGDYDGAHVFIAWAGAVFAGSSFVGRTLPAVLVPAKRRQIGTAAIAILSAVTLLMPPGQRIWTLLTTLDGSILAQQLGGFLGRDENADPASASDIPEHLAEWFADRSEHPDIEPSQPALVPKDSIVLLITIDAIRAELLNDDKYREHAPRLFEIISKSVRFTQARSPGSSTLTAMASMFSGKHRAQLDWRKTKGLNWNLASDKATRFTERLQEAKVRTFQTVAWKLLRQRHHIAAGFDGQEVIKAPEGQRFALAPQMLEPLRQQLKAHKRGPLFMFAHLMDAHEPYDSVTTEGTPFERHLAELTTCDTEIGRMWDLVEELGLLDRLVLIIASDHGEGFGLHSTPFHSNTVYEELIRVPLIIRAPGVEHRDVDTPVSLLDVGPTVLDLLGIDTPGHFMGQSLTGFLRGETPKLTRPIAGTARVAGKAPILYWYEPGGYKAIWNLKRGTREIYDLEKDPGELENIYDDLEYDELEPIRLLGGFFTGHKFFEASKKKTKTERAKKKKKKKGKKKKKKRKGKKKKKPKPAANKPDAKPAPTTSGGTASESPKGDAP